jgi:2-desacetyl-2-hydroxyethyl bacteriochlorophyllide A dehydrogenase
MDKHNYKIIFKAPYQVMVDEDEIPSPGSRQVLVRSTKSAISAGTEMLVYRGQFPGNILIDETIPGLEKPMNYPLHYGYSLVGEVIKIGEGVPESFIGKRVFIFSPHQTYTVISHEKVIVIPDEIADLNALFYPNMETAINLVQDSNPMIGEKSAVIGLGIVGLLTIALLQRFPLDHLIAVEKLEFRQVFARELGIEEVYGPESYAEVSRKFKSEDNKQTGFDLVIESSGSPAGLQLAIDMARFSGRIVVGSWYGNKPVQLELGSRFHRQRLQLISSQVSTISPGLMARWDKSRRGELVWKMIALINPSRWITNTFSINQAELAYELVYQHPERIMQVVFEY